MTAEKPPGDGPVLRGVGPAWPALVGEDEPAAPKWTNGRAFPAVWRDTLAFALGSTLAIQEQFRDLNPSRAWNFSPPSHSEADIDQAIRAKIHINLRILPLLANADLLVLDPSLALTVPELQDDDEFAAYSAEAKLPRIPLFIDFEAFDGSPVSWQRETWPFPFYLRGALCWQQDELLSVVPFGSVGERHPWGGTDYQAWTRWNFIQGSSSEWPDLGPGDFNARPNGEVQSWVDGDSDSICTHVGYVSFNLCRRVLSTLFVLEAFDIELREDAPSRQVRRRANRKGERVGLVPNEWPVSPLARKDTPPSVTPRMPIDIAPADTCPIPNTHARLAQCHTMWHDALSAYADPSLFTSRLNAVIQGLRSVTWVLQKELKSFPDFAAWYSKHQKAMKSDSRMKWLVSARNQIEKQGDLETASTAQVRVLASWLDGPATEIDVDPTSQPHEIARSVQVLGLPSRVMREGVLEVERRWTIEEFAEDEILDVLAHCFGVLSQILRAAHEKYAEDLRPCELAVDTLCEGFALTPHPSGRAPCMIANRRGRSVRRNLDSGALVEMDMVPIGGPEISREELIERYGQDAPFDLKPQEGGLFGAAEVFHSLGRKFFSVDGYLKTVVWLLREGNSLRQIALEPEDQREKYLAIDRIAEEVERLGADELIFTTEVWEAPGVAADDDRFDLRPAEREDRTEALITYALRRGQKAKMWRSSINRSPTGEVALGEMKSERVSAPLFLAPILKVWEGWTG